MCIIKKNVAHPRFSNIFKPIILVNQQVWRNRKRNWFLSSLACNICHRVSSFAFPDSFPRDCLPESWESLGIFEIVADFDSLLSIYDRDTVDPWKSWTRFDEITCECSPIWRRYGRYDLASWMGIAFLSTDLSRFLATIPSRIYNTRNDTCPRHLGANSRSTTGNFLDSYSRMVSRVLCTRGRLTRGLVLLQAFVS